MKKITEIFPAKPKTFSIELFPPKTEEGHAKLLNALTAFAGLHPDFISCTYGAGGGNRGKTLDIVEHIERTFAIPSVAHLTCVLNTRDQIRAILEDIYGRGIRNVLALRGDPPQDNPSWRPTKENFEFAYQLCQFIREDFQDTFAIGVAGFPEGHVNCPDLAQDAKYLKTKVDNGADYVITQLFFDNRVYFDYVKRLRALGVRNRILPGIIPITDYPGIVRFCANCGATVPEKVKAIFEPIAQDKEATAKRGIRFCIDQCRGLLESGAEGVHFYALNKIHPLDIIWQEIKDLL